MISHVEQMKSAIHAAHLQRKPIRMSHDKLTLFVEECYAMCRDGDVDGIPEIRKHTADLPQGVEFAVDGVPVVLDRVTLD